MGLPEFSAVPLTVRMQKRQLVRRILVQAFNASALTAVTLLCVEHFVPGGFQGLARQSLSVPALLKPASPPLSAGPSPDRLPDLSMPEAEPRREVSERISAGDVPSVLPEPQYAEAPMERSPARETWRKRLRRVDWLREIRAGGKIGSRFWSLAREPKYAGSGVGEGELRADGDSGDPDAVRLDALPAGKPGKPGTPIVLEGTIPLSAPRVGGRAVVRNHGAAAPDRTTPGESADVHRMRAASEKLSRDLARRTLILRWASAAAAGLAWFLLFFTLSGAPRALTKPWGGHQH